MLSHFVWKDLQYIPMLLWAVSTSCSHFQFSIKRFKINRLAIICWPSMLITKRKKKKKANFSLYHLPAWWSATCPGEGQQGDRGQADRPSNFDLWNRQASPAACFSATRRGEWDICNSTKDQGKEYLPSYKYILWQIFFD